MKMLALVFLVISSTAFADTHPKNCLPNIAKDLGWPALSAEQIVCIETHPKGKTAVGVLCSMHRWDTSYLYQRYVEAVTRIKEGYRFYVSVGYQEYLGIGDIVEVEKAVAVDRIAGEARIALLNDARTACIKQ